MSNLRILIVLTSHDQLGDTGQATGFWLEELANPYYIFLDADAAVTLASIQGGRAPLDPKSHLDESQTDDTKRFLADSAAQDRLANTIAIDQVNADDYAAIFLPGGLGTMWDFATSSTLRKAVALDTVVPFLLETRLRELGAKFESGPDWGPLAKQDGNLITGQNPASSGAAAKAVLAALV